MEDEIRILSLTGNLGYGYPKESLAAGMSRRPHLVGADNGSSDPGPYYLGSGRHLTKREQVRRDLGLSLAAARKAGVPYVIGTAGTSGGAPHVDEFLDILQEITARDGLSYRLATIGAEIDKATVKTAIREGRVRSMGKLPELTEEVVDATTRIVGQMGTGPFIEAFKGGADVVIAGRACDTAIYASYAIHKGFDPGLAFHMSKIIECGAQCAVPIGTSDCILGTLRSDHFELEPMNPIMKLTPVSVAAHMMYEQPDPYSFYEPEGLVDLENSRIEQVADNRVKVFGSKLHHADRPSIKLEGVTLRGYRTITVAGFNDPLLMQNVEDVKARVRDGVARLTQGALQPEDYELRFICYGQGGVMGRPLDGAHAGEIGLVIEAIGPTQDAANFVLSLARSQFLHCYFEGRKATAGNLAFPFSPSDFEGGAVYEFTVYHVMTVDDPDALFPVKFSEVH